MPDAPITAGEALAAGARQSGRWLKLTAVFYFFNLITAAAIVLPLGLFIAGDLAHSLESTRLLANFDVAWLGEAWHSSKGAQVMTILPAAGVLTVVFLLVNTFLAGGALAIFRDERAAFWGAAARYFPRLARLMLLSLVCYAIVFAVSGSVRQAISKMAESSIESRPWVMLGWLRFAVLALLLAAVNMLFDYAKALLVTHDLRSAFRAFRGAIALLSSDPWRAGAVYAVTALSSLVALALYHFVSEASGQTSTLAIAFVAVLRQVAVFVRIHLRMWAWSSEIELVRPAPSPPAPPIPIVPAVDPLYDTSI